MFIRKSLIPSNSNSSIINSNSNNNSSNGNSKQSKLTSLWKSKDKTNATNTSTTNVAATSTNNNTTTPTTLTTSLHDSSGIILDKISFDFEDIKKSFHGEGRTITAEFNNFYLVACYVPNSGKES
jgi:exonuclease III